MNLVVASFGGHPLALRPDLAEPPAALLGLLALVQIGPPLPPQVEAMVQGRTTLVRVLMRANMALCGAFGGLSGVVSTDTEHFVRDHLDAYVCRVAVAVGVEEDGREGIAYARMPPVYRLQLQPGNEPAAKAPSAITSGIQQMDLTVRWSVALTAALARHPELGPEGLDIELQAWTRPHLETARRLLDLQE